MRGDRHAGQVHHRGQKRDGQHRDVLRQQQSQPRHRRGDERFQRAAFALAGREIDRRIDGAGHRHQHENQRNERRQRKDRRTAETDRMPLGGRRQRRCDAQSLQLLIQSRLVERLQPRFDEMQRRLARRRTGAIDQLPYHRRLQTLFCVIRTLATIHGRQMQR